MTTEIKRLKAMRKVSVHWFLLCVLMTLVMEITGQHYFGGYDIGVFALACIIMAAYFGWQEDKNKVGAL